MGCAGPGLRLLDTRPLQWGSKPQHGMDRGPYNKRKEEKMNHMATDPRANESLGLFYLAKDTLGAFPGEVCLLPKRAFVGTKRSEKN